MKKPLTALRAGRLWAIASKAALLFSGILGCSSTTTAPTFVLGAVIDRSGSNAEPSWGDALALAESDMNAALAAAGHPDKSFHIVISDSRNDPPTAVARSLDLYQNQGIKALILDTSQNAVAVNGLNYDSDPTNDIPIPMQCSGCTSGSINNPTATNADPVQQAAFRNSQHWMFRTVMSTKLIAVIINRNLLQLGTPAADVSSTSNGPSVVAL